MLDMEKHKERVKWFTNDRLGMFIHWGLYALIGKGEWCRTRFNFSDEDYRKLMNDFTVDMYNPKEWAKLAKKSGIKYAVMTAKHHDGFCLFDSKFTEFKSTNTPSKRDLIKEYVEAFRDEGIKVGIYYSLLDWDHPDYPRDRIHPNRKDGVDRFEGINFDNYLEYMHNQVCELLTNYGKIDLLWFDYSYDDMVGEMWKATELTRMVRSIQPEIIINARLDAHDGYFGSLGEKEPKEYCGDFIGAESIVPYDGCRDYKGELLPWESCFTVSEAWSYRQDDTGAKSLDQLIKCIINVVSKGGNVLMGIAPDAKGNIAQDTVEVLKKLGEWLKINGESVYGCTAVSRPKPENGFLTGKGKTVYYHIMDKNVTLDPIYNFSFDEIESIALLCNGVKPDMPSGREHLVTCHYSDIVYLNLQSTSKLPDPIDTVVKIKLK